MVKKGDVYYADIDPVIGSEQKGARPVVIIQNDILNKNSPTTIAAMVTSKKKKHLPTHVRVKDKNSGLYYGSIVMLEQIRTLDKQRLGKMLGHINEKTMRRIDIAALCALEIKK